MKKASLPLTLLALLWVGSLWGAELKLPAVIRGDTDDFISVKADTTAGVVKWVVLDRGLKLFPPELLRDSRSIVVLAKHPGKYRVLAYTGDKDGPSEPAICTVEVGTVPPGPGPEPGPGPGPKPPDDPLVKIVADAFALETDAERGTQKAALAALYRQAAQAAFLQKFDTWGALFSAMAEAARTLGVSGKLPAVQKAIAVELKAKLPTLAAQKMDAEGRTLAAATFTRISLALEAAKGGKR